MKKNILSLFIGFISIFSNAQSDSAWSGDPTINWSAFAEAFYAYSANQPDERYLYYQGVNYTRHNELGLNHAMLKANLKHAKYRGNVALQAGLYPILNYSTTPDESLFRNVMEANVGIALNKKNTWWLDAGIFNSHIGFESIVSFDNWTLTRSFMAEYSPYYMSGGKITYQPNEKWEAMVMLTNGWQRIVKSTGNNRPSISTLLKYTPSKKTTVGWATYAGSDLPDSNRRMRYFSNLYGQFQLTKRLGLTAAIDVGGQQELKDSDFYQLWYTPVVIVRYQMSDKWAVAVRGEFYEDKNQVVVSSRDDDGFVTQGSSINFDFKPSKRIACRMETRWLRSQGKEYRRGDDYVNDNVYAVASISIFID